MNKGLIIGLVVLIVIFGLVYYVYPTSEGILEDSRQEKIGGETSGGGLGVLADCDKMSNEDQKANCVIDIAESKSDESLCESIGLSIDLGLNIEGFGRSKCYIVVASKKQDLSICEKILTKPQRESCYGDVAESKLDISICELITDIGIKNTCYLSIAYGLGDQSICELQSDQKVVEGCKFAIESGIF